MSRHTSKSPFREYFRESLETWAFIVFRTEATWAQVSVAALYTLLLVGAVLGAGALVNCPASQPHDPLSPVPPQSERLEDLRRELQDEVDALTAEIEQHKLELSRLRYEYIHHGFQDVTYANGALPQTPVDMVPADTCLCPCVCD